MGHLRFGRLPKTLEWQEVVDLLADARPVTAVLGSAIADAAKKRLKALARDESLNYAVWLMVRLSNAADNKDFAGELQALGFSASDDLSLTRFISGLSDKVRQRTAAYVHSGHFSEIASLSLQDALRATVATRSPSFFSTTVEDLQAAFRAYSSPKRFGFLSRVFLGEFFNRTLRSALEREITNHVGPSGSIASVAACNDFSDAVGHYAKQSSRITEVFATEWYSKRNWKSPGRVTQAEVFGFLDHAIDKLIEELREGPQP